MVLFANLVHKVNGNLNHKAWLKVGIPDICILPELLQIGTAVTFCKADEDHGTFTCDAFKVSIYRKAKLFFKGKKSCAMEFDPANNAPDGFISHDGFFDVLQYDDLDLMIDDNEMEKSFSEAFNLQDVPVLNSKLKDLKLNDVNDFNVQDPKKVFSGCSSSKTEMQHNQFSLPVWSDSTISFKSRLETSFGNKLTDKLQDGICDIFDKYSVNVPKKQKRKTEQLIFELLKLFDESFQGSNSGISDDDRATIVSSKCEDILEFHDVSDDDVHFASENSQINGFDYEYALESGNSFSTSTAAMAHNIPIPLSVNMLVSRLVVEQIGVFYGDQDLVVVCNVVVKDFYDPWFTASVMLERLLGHRDFNVAMDHVARFCFIRLRSYSDVDIVVGHRFRWYNEEAIFIRVSHLRPLPNDPADMSSVIMLQ
ncbi:hypothetical protein ACP70R_005021 [Stipagrostis hirtigluma subsp. patula]